MEDQHGYFIQTMKRVLAVGADYQTELDENNALSTIYSTLASQKETAETLSSKLTTSTKSFTTAGEALREKSATEMSIAASVASSYGTTNAIPEFKNMSRFSFSEMRRGSFVNQLANSKIILETIQKYQSELSNSGLDSQMITQLINDISEMEKMSGIPQNMIDQHKNDKIQLVNHLKNCHRTFDEELDKMMQLYRLKNSDFYLAYQVARKTRHHHLKRKVADVDTATKTGILELLLLDKATTSALPGAKLVVSGLNLVADSDEDGETYSDLLTPGSYQGKVFMDGYKDAEFEFSITAGETTDQQLLMEKV